MRTCNIAGTNVFAKLILPGEQYLASPHGPALAEEPLVEFYSKENSGSVFINRFSVSMVNQLESGLALDSGKILTSEQVKTVQGFILIFS